MMIAKYRNFSLAILAGMCLVFTAGCGDTFRNFITPIPKQTGNPAGLSHAVVTSVNPAGNGSDLHINVSGDSIAGLVPLGLNPLFFGDKQGRAFVLNSDNTISLYTGLLPLTTTVSIATQPGTATGQIAAGANGSGSLYVVNRTSNNVSFVPSTSSTVAQLINVGTEPVMAVGGPANSKIYVVNHTSNDVTVISAIDNTILKTIPVGAQPIWAVMSTDGEGVFVVNQGEGTLSFIDTTLDQEICGTTSFVTCGPGTRIQLGSSPNFAFYDSPRRRVYVSNTGSNNISLINADGINFGVNPPVLPTKIASIPVSGSPLSLAPLQDGSRVYVALANCTDPGTNHTNFFAHLPNCKGNMVSVVDVTALRETKTIPVGPGAVSIDAAADSTRVYVVSALDTTVIQDNVNAVPQAARTIATPSVTAINTSLDTVLRYTNDPSVTSLVPSFLAPPQNPNCTPFLDTTFNRTVPIPCVGQTAFSVHVIP
ncbi:MAG TPA: YncE family protein [Candidatus Angelobacter sp.]|nr:YncE family protein [Candidatus Angelobacter sp.]